ncbi:MAG TPA: hypothetical protein VLL04_10260, partial [Rhizomicrobium sp.]|nr:hypothetical protein [Rhizomicrobium sp.]
HGEQEPQLLARQRRPEQWKILHGTSERLMAAGLPCRKSGNPACRFLENPPQFVKLGSLCRLW